MTVMLADAAAAKELASKVMKFVPFAMIVRGRLLYMTADVLVSVTLLENVSVIVVRAAMGEKLIFHK